MALVPLLPLFHFFNKEFFEGSLTRGSQPLVSVRWSDGRLRKTAGFYRRIERRFGQNTYEIVLSRPLLEYMPRTAVQSTLCHEMIHAWIDLVLKVKEAHGPNFRNRMQLINEYQKEFHISVRHSFPVPKSLPRWWASCPRCGFRSPYKRLVRGAACRTCCNTHFGGQWDVSCLLKYEPNF